MKDVTIGLIGLGTVGTGVARLLTEHADRIARRAGRPIRWKWAAVRDPSKPRDVRLDGVRLTTDVAQSDRRSRGRRHHRDDGRDRARLAVSCWRPWPRASMSSRPTRPCWPSTGRQVFAQARAAGRAVAFEGSVGGGIPIVQALGIALAANQVQSLAAIVNGTCNFILTRMTSEGLAVRRSAAAGPAARLCRGRPDPRRRRHRHGPQAGDPRPARVRGRRSASTRSRARGSTALQLADLKYAGELGYAIKLLALAKLSDAGLELRVAPTLVKHGTPLAEVRGPYNAIRVVGDAVGDTLFYGRGAGAMPTASAVVGDLIDVVTGRAGLPSRLAEPLVRIRAAGSPRTSQPGQEPVLPPASRSPTARACWPGWPRSSASTASASPASSSTIPATMPPKTAPSPWSS